MAQEASRNQQNQFRASVSRTGTARGAPNWQGLFGNVILANGELTVVGRLQATSSAGTGKNCALSMRVPNPRPVLDKNRVPMGAEIYPVPGLGSGGRLLT